MVEDPPQGRVDRRRVVPDVELPVDDDAVAGGEEPGDALLVSFDVRRHRVERLAVDLDDERSRDVDGVEPADGLFVAHHDLSPELRFPRPDALLPPRSAVALRCTVVPPARHRVVLGMGVSVLFDLGGRPSLKKNIFTLTTIST